MSKRGHLLKLILIIERLKKSPASRDEIGDYIDKNNTGGYNFSKSIRTFQRDFNDIRNIFDFEIKYDRGLKMYKLLNGTKNNGYGLVYEAIEITNALNIARQYEPYLFPENRNFSGVGNISKLLRAIVDKKYVQYDYIKFYDDKPKKRVVQPLFLKQFKLRWYLLAKEENNLKVFGLDRMSNLEILNKTFTTEDMSAVQNAFKYSFGIMFPKNLDTEPPEEIKIEFDRTQVLYYETLPLHWTQQIEYKDNDKALLTVQVYPTYDFLLEIISNGDTYKIISPKSVKEQIKKILSDSLKRNR